MGQISADYCKAQRVLAGTYYIDLLLELPESTWYIRETWILVVEF